ELEREEGKGLELYSVTKRTAMCNLERSQKAIEAQRETNRVLLSQVAQSQAEIQELRQRLSQMRTAENPAWPIQASLVLQKVTPEDNVEAYLLTFERSAKWEGWPKEQWAGIVAPFLVGDAQKAYFNLELEAAANYTLLKAEILAQAGVTPMVQAQRFHSWTYCSGKARSQMFDLIHLAQWWLQPEVNTAARIVELIVMDRYLRALPRAIWKWVGQGDPTNAQELIALIEKQIAAKELLKASVAGTPQNHEHTLNLKSGTGTGKTKEGLGDAEEQFRTAKELEEGSLSAYQCYKCNECPNTKKLMDCSLGEPEWVSVNVDGKETMALTDSGSAMTLVSSTLV
uniref:SCAN box domain-containing protein n=1 Tax=Latimeria chalumnae TaxID=7897 RepID=H3A7G6_LATCH